MTSPSLRTQGADRDRPDSWQLLMFEKSLKKKQKLALLLRQVGDLSGKQCLLITNGDNNGALNWHCRQHGGSWVWVENESEHIDEMRGFLQEPVLKGQPDSIPVEDGSQDVVISIDVHEHLDDCEVFNRELARVTRPGGTVVVTTPNGDSWKPVTVLKHLLGMKKEQYGHKVVGFNRRQHEEMLGRVGLTTVSAGSYSRFFTELLELGINFAYVKVLSRKSREKVSAGTIAPSSGKQLNSVGKQFRLYAAIYPFLSTISKLDLLLTPLTGYAVSVVARKDP